MRPPEDVVLLRDMLDHASIVHDITWDVVAGDLPRLATSLERALEDA